MDYLISLHPKKLDEKNNLSKILYIKFNNIWVVRRDASPCSSSTGKEITVELQSLKSGIIEFRKLQ